MLSTLRRACVTFASNNSKLLPKYFVFYVVQALFSTFLSYRRLIMPVNFLRICMPFEWFPRLACHREVTHAVHVRTDCIIPRDCCQRRRYFWLICFHIQLALTLRRQRDDDRSLQCSQIRISGGSSRGCRKFFAMHLAAVIR